MIIKVYIIEWRRSPDLMIGIFYLLSGFRSDRAY